MVANHDEVPNIVMLTTGLAPSPRRKAVPNASSRFAGLLLCQSHRSFWGQTQGELVRVAGTPAPPPAAFAAFVRPLPAVAIVGWV